MALQQYPFFDVFNENPDGTLSPKRPINVSGITLAADVSLSPGVEVGGIDFHKFKNFPIAADEQGGILLIRGFYQSS